MLFRSSYLATIRNAQGDIRARVSFTTEKAAMAYIHDAIRFERFGRGHVGSIAHIKSLMVLDHSNDIKSKR